MKKTYLSIFALFFLLLSCGGETEETSQSEETTNTTEEDSVVGEEIIVEDPISKRIDTEWKLEWLLEQNEYEGKSPDCNIALFVEIDGQTDTVEMWTQVGFIEEFSDDDYTMVGLPEKVITAVTSFSDGIVVAEETPYAYSIWNVEISRDSIQSKEQIGQIGFNDEDIMFYTVSRPIMDGYYYDFGEEIPW